MARRNTVNNKSAIEIRSDGSTIMLRLINADILEVEEGVLTPAAVMSFDQAMEMAASITRIVEDETEDPEE